MILDRKINIVIPTVDFGVLIEMWKSVGSYNDINLIKYPCYFSLQWQRKDNLLG